jgi:hypothetical protein
VLAVSIAGYHKLQEYLERVDHHSKVLDDRQAQRERIKADERKKKEMETKEYLDQQVEAKRERKEVDKDKEYRLAARVHADVQAFEDSKGEHKLTYQSKMHEHLGGLMKQIEEHKQIPKKAPHVAKIGMPGLADQ